MHHHGTIALAPLVADGTAWLALTMFAAGLLGGLSHCAAMCGPFVLAQVAAGIPADGRTYGTLQRLRGAGLVPYHLGRATSYVLLGALGGALAGQVTAMAGLRWLPAALLAAAACAFVAWGLAPLIGIPGSGWAARAAAPLSRILAPLLGRPTGVRGYLLGLALGFLPCGLLYGALAAAAGSGSAFGGGIVMLAFTAGTVPALVAVGFAGVLFGRRWSGTARRAAPAIMLANAAVLLWFAALQL